MYVCQLHNFKFIICYKGIITVVTKLRHKLIVIFNRAD